MNIKCTQNMYKSANGASDITYYILQPEGVALRGVVQICHGVCDYFSRYTVFAKYLCGLGFIVCGNDHLGHGASASKTADLGFFGARDGWKYLVQDVAKLSVLMRERHPTLPYFMLGHSMGSMLVRLCVSRPDCAQLSGIILCGTAGNSPLLRTYIRVADSVARSRGATYRSAFLSRCAFKTCNRKIKDHETPFDWVTRDRQMVELYQSDEKCNFMLTATAYRDLFMLTLQANQPRSFRQTPRSLPILLLSGDRDPIGACGDGVRQVASFYRSSGIHDLDAIFYKGARHEILNEVNRQEVYGDISRWLERQLAAAHAMDDNTSTVQEEHHADYDNGEHPRKAL